MEDVIVTTMVSVLERHPGIAVSLFPQDISVSSRAASRFHLSGSCIAASGCLRALRRSFADTAGGIARRGRWRRVSVQNGGAEGGITKA